jgi:membrane protein implicated in regulation of membrane protease activity
MNKLKTILILVAVILGMLVALVAIGFIYTAMNYLLLLGFVVVIVFAVLKYRSSQPLLNKSDSQHELRQATRTLEEYKRRLK